ncbi:STAS/SEC14 domain-containing protein [Microbulbifer marinus]|uniref:SpoIIAA-like n=1 Tax=Microbulbifer marinus TaxID=658218 RepID=A0A1H4BDM7_9GAMM|nr:STAS/SEC14 domain-containing protein [Microbulbifer marinus]SEA45932.1 SpoIIAA-like [Microbulbifer marinus]
MEIERHGISIGIERIGPEFFLYFKAIGRLTHDDYERISPLLDYALEGVKDPQVQMLVDAREFEGWELRAAWDDFKLALKHGNEFSRIAIVGEDKWQEVVARIASWFVSGEVRFFEEQEDALKWLSQPLSQDTVAPTDSKSGGKRIFPAHT